MLNSVIVFDIDGALAHQDTMDEKEREEVKKEHPDSPMAVFRYKNQEVTSFWLPYMDVLFDYLINVNARVVIFSSSIEERNVAVIDQVLTQVYGEAKYRDLKQQGQFEILSKQHLRPGDREKGEYGNFIKDFTVVVKEGEDVENAILIEDQPSYTAHDQRPCIKVLDLENWPFTKSSSPRSFSKNGTYYLLGLFKEYFENSKYSSLPLRPGIVKIFEDNYEKARHITKEAFYPGEGFYQDGQDSRYDTIKSTTVWINSGLEEVKKRYPDAILYGTGSWSADD